MSDSLHPTSSPLSLDGQLSSLGQMRVYEDDVALDRAWKRLESRRRHRAGPGPVARTVMSAALVAAGVLLGMFIERPSSPPVETATVSSERISSLRAPAGPVTDSDLRRPRQVAPHLPGETTKKKPRKHAPLHAQSPLLIDEQSEFIEEAFDDAPSVVELFDLPQEPTWAALADRGEYAAAFQKLDESGGFDAVLSSGSSEELMTLVDIARYVGRQGRAIQALRAVTERFQGDANAPLAAMILGNLLSRAGDAEGASAAYALNRHLSPGGDFAQDALVREFDMAMSDGDLLAVERLRLQYEAEFPDGRHKEEMRAEAADLAERLRTQPVPQSSDTGAPVRSNADSSASGEPEADSSADESTESEQSASAAPRGRSDSEKSESASHGSEEDESNENK